MVQPGNPRQSASRATMLASLRWWGPALTICAICLAAGIVELVLNGRVAESVAMFAIVVVAGSFAIQARREFRRGWRYGYETALRVLVEKSIGRVTDVETRAVVLGDPTPDPWDTHTPLHAQRSVR
ncbi:hypothetical protein [Cellulomonas endometrii]|uniref:hypothetical protein n=1 Tax=Cellulomonas endometrii TaxID=3036301 RepID=UPI0024AD8E0D|nr:hypothetical protein [Cellulomonas endometrii]